ncbi:MAG: glycosyl transferase [Sphingobacteriales bacterium]|jgi:uncharacterized protein (TIGR00661 family)|nr:glycosyl transferase [Sphingobacteriales bacterium]
MKILYAIQGTGNGHISRAMELIPHLNNYGEVDILVSSSHHELKLPYHVKYNLKGLGFVFGKLGGIDLMQTYLQLDTRRFLNEVRSLPVEKYDLILNDFEPVSAWACRLKNKACIGLSNQNATLHALAPRPKRVDFIGKTILEHYAPCSVRYGFHYTGLDSDVFTPVIRSEIRTLTPTQGQHICVYLPSYDDRRLILKLQRFIEEEFIIFSKKSRVSFSEKNVTLKPLDNKLFTEYLSSSAGVITNAGFGTTSEALFLGKKLLAVPMKGQLEQQCNAAFLAALGVSIMPSFKRKHIDVMDTWLKQGLAIQLNYPDKTSELVDLIINRHSGNDNVASNGQSAFDELMENLFNPGPALS